jgi:signal transduction histidine kinase
VARILALPAVVVLVLLGIVAAGQIQGYRSSQATADSVRLTLAVQNLVHELQSERGVTAGVLGGNSGFRTEVTMARRKVDQQRASVQALVAGSGTGRVQVRAALQQFDGLAAIRAATDASTANRQAAFTYFTDRITALASIDVGLDRTPEDMLRRSASTLQALQELSEALAQERAFLNGVFSAGGFARGEFVQFAAMRAARETAMARFQRFATPGEKSASDAVFATGASQITTYFEQVAVDAADGRHVVVNPQSWWSSLTTVLDDLNQLQRHVGSVIQIRAHDLQQASAQRITMLLVIVLLTFAGSIYLATLASTSITKPLNALAEEANDVATERLPSAVSRVQAGGADDAPSQPPAPVHIPARATTEIRSVATALDRLQSAAHELAGEQALQRQRTIESLANLGRRNQNLIRRQLGFITTLEHQENDPSALANLFELDHLATRMRRNAASLLVLVDASSPRQWSTCVPIADVIRAAASEVEEYQRVSLRRVDDAFVAGTAIGSVAHLLAELIENGLDFSPPDSEVEVQGRRLLDGYLIAVTDQGVGMSTEDLNLANRRLRGEEDFIAAPTRFLGHFVVGKLAQETGSQVELLPSPITGITARVTLPPSALASSPAIEDGSGSIPLPSVSVEVQPVSLEMQPADKAASGHLPVGPGPLDKVPQAIEHPQVTSQLPATVSSMLGSHPRVHPFAGNLTVTTPNARPPQPPPGSHPAVPSSSPPPMTASGTLRVYYKDGEPARTRNGLRKRLPRERQAATAAAQPSNRAVNAPAAARPTVDSSPAEVRMRLTALRTGIQRGQVAEAADAQPARSDHVGKDSE